MSIAGNLDDKWAIRLAFDSTLNALRVTESSSVGGEIVSEAGTVTTTPINLPSTPSGDLTKVLVQCGVDNTSTLRLDISLDGGTVYHRIAPGMSLEWDMAGSSTQIQIKAASGSVQYYFTANRVV